MFKDCLQNGLITPDPQRELGPNDEKPSWYNEQAFYKYHKVRGHGTNDCMLLRKALKKLLDDEKVQYEACTIEFEGTKYIIENIIFYVE